MMAGQWSSEKQLLFSNGFDSHAWVIFIMLLLHYWLSKISLLLTILHILLNASAVVKSSEHKNSMFLRRKTTTLTAHTGDKLAQTLQHHSMDKKPTETRGMLLLTKAKHP